MNPMELIKELFVWAAVGKPNPKENPGGYLNWFEVMREASRLIGGRDMKEAFGGEVRAALRVPMHESNVDGEQRKRFANF